MSGARLFLSPVHETPCSSGRPSLPCATRPQQRTTKAGSSVPMAATTSVATAGGTARSSLVCRAVVTDQAVPEGHKGLHGFLYGEGGAEVHDFARDYVLREVSSLRVTLCFCCLPTDGGSRDRGISIAESCRSGSRLKCCMTLCRVKMTDSSLSAFLSISERENWTSLWASMPCMTTQACCNTLVILGTWSLP